MYTWVCPLFITPIPLGFPAPSTDGWNWNPQFFFSVLSENWQPKVANFIAYLEEYIQVLPLKDQTSLGLVRIIDKITPDTCAQIATQENNSIGCY